MSKQKPTPTQPEQPATDQRDAVIAALQQDQGPTVLTVAVNIVTGRTSISGIMRTDTEMRAILAALGEAQHHVQEKLEQAAEERGRNSAAQPSKE